MSMESPASVLYDSVGGLSAAPLDVAAGAAVGTTHALLSAGTDGTNARLLLTDSSGRQVVVGQGVAGTPAGGVMSVQGVAGGTALPVSGTVTATNPSVSATGAAIPASATMIGASDGTNLVAPRAYDTDTGGGTEFEMGFQLRVAKSGGSAPFGTTSDPIVVDEALTPGSSVAAVGQSITSVTLLAANSARKGFKIYNDGTSTLFVKMNAGAATTTTSYTVQVKRDGFFEDETYSGAVTGIWGSGTGGNALVTEIA